MTRRLLDCGHKEVLVHGMGASITKAIYVVQDILLHYGDQIQLETRHGTVDVVDDVIGECESSVQERRVSALILHLRLAEPESGNVGAALKPRISSWLSRVAKPEQKLSHEDLNRK